MDNFLLFKILLCLYANFWLTKSTNTISISQPSHSLSMFYFDLAENIIGQEIDTKREITRCSTLWYLNPFIDNFQTWTSKYEQQYEACYKWSIMYTICIQCNKTESRIRTSYLMAQLLATRIRVYLFTTDYAISN